MIHFVIGFGVCLMIAAMAPTMFVGLKAKAVGLARKIGDLIVMAAKGGR